jgi:glucose/arabinose dehydrogenase
VVRGAAFLDLSDLVSCCSERGLLGLAFHPGYEANGLFYVNYTDVNGDTVVAEYARGASPEIADPTARRILFTVDQPFPNHNGGMLAFGPDDLLYIGLGDGGGQGDPFGNAQRLDTKLGKILRIDVDTYPAPAPGNVRGGDPDVWDFGVRNPWRFSFDRATGDLYIGDVGEVSFEEIDVEPRGQGGRNYGWSVTEGLHCFGAASCDTAGITFPVIEYDHESGDCSVTGGYVYRGAAIPELHGRYFYGDFCSNRVRTFVWNGTAATDARELTADLESATVLGAVTSFGEDAAGELLVVDRRGAVFRVVRE